MLSKRLKEKDSMKNKTLSVTLCVAGLLALCVAAGAQTKGKKPENKSKPAAAQPSADDMQNAMQNAMPGAAHSNLAKLAGEYTTATKAYFEPGAPPQDSTGEAKLWMTLDGRFLAEDDSANFMGQPTKGFRMIGYNNATKRYEGIMTYTMSTSIMTLNGTSTDGGKTITFAGNFNDPSGIKLDIVLRQTSDDQFVIDLSAKTPDGKPGPRLVTTYTRKK